MHSPQQTITFPGPRKKKKKSQANTRIIALYLFSGYAALRNLHTKYESKQEEKKESESDFVKHGGF